MRHEREVDSSGLGQEGPLARGKVQNTHQPMPQSEWPLHRGLVWRFPGDRGHFRGVGLVFRAVAAHPPCLWFSDGPTHTSSPKPPPRVSLGLELNPYVSCPQLFHEAAYQADDRQDLLSAISEFLDGSIVIPPSEVEGRDLLRSVAAFQRELLRKRREREQTKVEMTTQGGYTAPGKGQTLWGPEPPTAAHRPPPQRSRL